MDYSEIATRFGGLKSELAAQCDELDQPLAKMRRVEIGRRQSEIKGEMKILAALLDEEGNGEEWGDELERPTLTLIQGGAT